MTHRVLLNIGCLSKRRSSKTLPGYTFFKDHEDVATLLDMLFGYCSKALFHMSDCSEVVRTS